VRRLNDGPSFPQETARHTSLPRRSLWGTGAEPSSGWSWNLAGSGQGSTTLLQTVPSTRINLVRSLASGRIKSTSLGDVWVVLDATTARRQAKANKGV
jgi:hypothetical protein